VVPSAGTALRIQSEQAVESELEQLLIGYEGQVAAGRARSKKAIDLAQADIYGQKARNVRTAGRIGAGSSLLTGFSNTGRRFT